MAKKRILVITCSADCRHLRSVEDDCEFALKGLYCAKDLVWRQITKKDCHSCKHKLLTGITRQRAIERMAVAIDKESFNQITTPLEMAEAALDALLDGE